jgi:hypothetical protein
MEAPAAQAVGGTARGPEQSAAASAGGRGAATSGTAAVAVASAAAPDPAVSFREGISVKLRAAQFTLDRSARRIASDQHQASCAPSAL